MKKYNVSINDRKFIVNAQDELEAIKKVKDSLFNKKSKINQQDANPSKEDIKDTKLTSKYIVEKAKQLGGQVKQNGASGVLGIVVTSSQSSDEFANWLEKNNIHYDSDGRQYYIEIKDTIKDRNLSISEANEYQAQLNLLWKLFEEDKIDEKTYNKKVKELKSKYGIN